MSLKRFYGYKTQILVPTVAQAEEGFYLDVAPVTICDTSNRQLLEQTLLEMLEQENPVVPTPERCDPHGSGSPILEALQLKKWLKFEAEATMYSIHVQEGGIDFYSSGNPVGGIWKVDQSRQTHFDKTDDFKPLVDAIIKEVLSDQRARLTRVVGGLALLPPPRQQPL